MQIINMCDHDIIVHDQRFNPSGKVLRVRNTWGERGYVCGVPIDAPSYDHELVQFGTGPDFNLDDPDLLFIVSNMVAARFPRPNFAVLGQRISNRRGGVEHVYNLVYAA